eukprot:CAMPEP_0174744064 /NCGR_PEP_ID=MMETSP1094-20130205/83248_1 /TAXON_ID=156173 /ORGANISM="Chrysochromulina brevifilum, Strain UTEX LB 985" /LENGTH=54 /DNA_ID=CAMNT_0015948377 /DNA_START=137 /DNA_END=298 /DNA_ORIENTATION=+
MAPIEGSNALAQCWWELREEPRVGGWQLVGCQVARQRARVDDELIGTEDPCHTV